MLQIVTFRVTHSRGEMHIGRGRLCLSVCQCLSHAAFPHYWTDQNVSWGMVGVPSSCAILGGFVISPIYNRFRSLLRQHSAEREMSASACTRSMAGYDRPME